MADKLNAVENVDLVYINIDSISFSYKNKLSRIGNVLRKTFSFPGLKEINRTNYIKNKLSNQFFDQILVIRPDKISKSALLCLRENTQQLVCYLFDGIENFKDQKKTLSYFDIVYSYDKKDAEKYNFTFLSNYIYDDEIEKKPITNLAFNISSYDKRFPFLENLAKYLKQIKVSFRFIVKNEKLFSHDLIEVSERYLSISEVKIIIAESLALVDIQKENQQGLSFRIFEALGYRKKIITNNQDIITYDFYNPNNIFVITEDNYQVSKDFFDSPYVEIPLGVLKKYHINNWILVVFNVECDL
ncbi:hypothetical protein EOD40_08880 [Flavobacterium sufflavum]|uniref:Uncharacterized protein n=1 Tax=Flavobacterium sufflavum TaxID=1921138 RepID=A0A3S2UJP7_9FLAO|nr:hypothetical protein [Flavobacterium sufflavum]RVT76607.1 hypothetical protein EOD40_08880 [Flavobacterium sufflavum]